jgi:ketol-acid reductoisomerase
VEELTQSLMPLVAENGMDWMYANCSTTAQRGALDWWKKFRDATAPVFNELYDSVSTGKESQRSIDLNSKDDYREKLEVELKELRESEMWQAGRTVRGLRPENQPKASSVAPVSSTKEVFSQLSAKSESVG